MHRKTPLPLTNQLIQPLRLVVFVAERHVHAVFFDAALKRFRAWLFCVGWFQGGSLRRAMLKKDGFPFFEVAPQEEEFFAEEGESCGAFTEAIGG